MAFIAIHVVQAVPAALMNQDDAKQPKTIQFGDAVRLRISSQALKRPARNWLREQMAGLGEFAQRTRFFPREVARELVATGHDPDEAAVYAAATFEGADLGMADDGLRTQNLLFSPQSAATDVADAIHDQWEEFAWQDKPPADGKGKKKAATAVPPERVLVAPKTVAAATAKAFQNPAAIDVALFGRMLATLKGAQVDGAVYVAHGMSLTPAVIEDDFFTAVDDRADHDAGDAAGGMLGTKPITSGLMYRTAVVDVQQLAANLVDTGADPGKVAAAAIQALILSLPQSGRTGSAAFTPPAFVLGTVSDSSAATSHADQFFTALRGDHLIGRSADLLAAAHDSVTVLLGTADTARWLLVHPESKHLDTGVRTVDTSIAEFSEALAQKANQ